MFARTASLPAVLLLCSSCADTGDDDVARVSLELTATPNADLDARVTIERIELQGATNSTVVLREEPVTVDLTDLASETSELVRQQTVPPGHYHELRIVLSGGYLQVAGEGLFATPDYPEVPAGAEVAGHLQMPSLGQSGLKVKLAEPAFFEVAQNIVMLRFDVAESFGHGTGANKWVMHPVIHGADIINTAELIVNLDARLQVVSDMDLTLRVVDATGNLEARAPFLASVDPGLFRASLDGLLPEQGPYQLAIESSGALAENVALPSNVALEAGKTMEIDVTASAP